MASKVENQAKEKANVVVRFITSSYETGIKASEDISLTAWDIPANILEGMGVEADKTDAIKNVNRKVIGGVYRGVDNMARKGTSIAVAPWKGVANAITKLRGKGKAAKPKAKAAKKEAVKPEAKAKSKAAAKQAAAPKKAKSAAKAPKVRNVEKKAA